MESFESAFSKAHQGKQELSNQYITSRASSYFYLTALDVNVKFFSKNHIPFVIVSVFVFLTLLLPPILLLVLYPTHCFISMLLNAVNG